MASQLVKNKGYPKALMQMPNVGCLQRGLIIDKKFGIVVKLDWNSNVAHAQLNTTRSLKHAEIVSVYGGGPINLAEQTRWMVLTTGFEAPLATLLLRYAMVRPSIHKDADALRIFFEDMGEAFGSVFGGGSVGKGGGAPLFIKALKSEPEKYLVPRSKAFIEWLRRLNEAQETACFVVTNASIEFVNLVMPAALGQDWRSLFSSVVVSASKPSFFVKGADTPSKAGRVSKMALLEPADVTRGLPAVYQGGTSAELLRHLAVHKGLQAGDLIPDVAYVGDHLLTDVVACKQQAQWKSVAVVEELTNFEEVVMGPNTTPCGGYLTTPQAAPSYWARVIHESADITVADCEDFII